MRLKQLVVLALIYLLKLVAWLARIVGFCLVLLARPFVMLGGWILRPLVLTIYRQYLKVLTRLKRSAFMQNKVLFIFGNKYFIHVIVSIITIFVASTNLLQAKELKQDEVFAKNSALYEIVNPDGGINDNIIETGLPAQGSSSVSYIATDGNMVATIPNLDPAAESPRTIGDQLATAENTTALVSSSVIETKFGVRSGISEYKVKNGDTVGEIAQRFGITVSTLLWANNLTSSSYIKPGDTLKILPSSGISYTVVDGDTLEKIIEKYKGNLEETIKVNDIGEDHAIPVGTEIVVVDGTPPPPPPPPVQRYYPSYGSTDGQFRNDNYTPVITGQKLNWPAGCHSTPTTYWGHGLARDIPCPIGTPIYAAESGTVYIRNSGCAPSSWSCGGGYGNYMDVVHGGGMTTRYAHLSAFNITSGQSVSRGQVIGFIGSTGRSTGPHLHFEVMINGVKQEPLYYIQ
ncbi:MAG: peptidase M23 [uncultured bacterium]|nr:MAG: peptidase M23 [uncultured bacterium]